MYSCAAAELAILANGFSIRVDRHEREGKEIVLVFGERCHAPPRHRRRRLRNAHGPSRGTRAIEAPKAPILPVAPMVPATPLQLVERAAEKHGLPAEFVKLVAKAESAFNPKAISSKGAIGLMQLMPKPWPP